MKPEFSVEVIDADVLEEIPDTWQPSDFRALLEEMDFGSTADLVDEEAREMCIMSLQDLDPEDAAAVLLRYRLSAQLKGGQIENVSNEMLDEKMWEEYASVELHEQMFNVASLLYRAFPRVVPEPDAVRVDLDVTANNEAASKILRDGMDEACLARLLADGMPDTAVLRRLYAEQLSGAPFPEASTLIWIVHTEMTGDQVARISVTSSGYWLDTLRETKRFTSSAFPDDKSDADDPSPEKKAID